MTCVVTLLVLTWLKFNPNLFEIPVPCRLPMGSSSEISASIVHLTHCSPHLLGTMRNDGATTSPPHRLVHCKLYNRPNPFGPDRTRPGPARHLGACPPTGTTLTIIALWKRRFTRSALGQQARKNQLEIGHRILTSGLCTQSWMASEHGGREKSVGTGRKPRNWTIATITTTTTTTTATTHWFEEENHHHL